MREKRPGLQLGVKSAKTVKLVNAEKGFRFVATTPIAPTVTFKPTFLLIRGDVPQTPQFIPGTILPTDTIPRI